jgi:hypothetical protein
MIQAILTKFSIRARSRVCRPINYPGRQIAHHLLPVPVPYVSVVLKRMQSFSLFSFHFSSISSSYAHFSSLAPYLVGTHILFPTFDNSNTCLSLLYYLTHPRVSCTHTTIGFEHPTDIYLSTIPRTLHLHFSTLPWCFQCSSTLVRNPG